MKRVCGTLIGHAAGDKNHGPSHMAMRLAQSLLERRCFDPDDIFSRYLDWHRQGSFDTGRVAGIVLELGVRGLSAAKAAARAHEELNGMTAGVNPAHRIVPLAMAGFIPDEDLAMLANQEAALTHAHPLAGDGAAAVSLLCRRLIRGADWNDALEYAASARLPEVRQALVPGELVMNDLHAGGFAPHALAAAVWHVNIATCFAQALETSLDFAGPANYCPVLVGAIAGARWGADEIAANELSGHPLKEEMTRLAEGLSSSWIDVPD